MGSPLKLSIIATAQDWVNEHLEAVDNTAFHTLYVADHPSFATTDSWTWLAYAAARTKRIRLGTHVTGASFHHPTRLAKQVTTVDNLSGGRAVLGIGTGYEVQDYKPYGFPMPSFKGRVDYLEEMIVVLKALFSGNIDGFTGEYFDYEGVADFAPLPVQKPYPPIMVGLNRAGLALKVASRHADAINTWQLSPSQVSEIVGPLANACGEVGRDPNDVAITCDVVMARGADQSGAQALAYQIRDMARGWGRDNSVTDWNEDGVLYGDGDSMRAQLDAFAAVGATEVTVAVSDIEDVLWLDDAVAKPLSAAAA